MTIAVSTPQIKESELFLLDSRCSCCFCTRHGGNSSGLYDSLNVGLLVGDDEQSVLENRSRIKGLLQAEYLLSAQQTHGSNIYCLKEQLTADCEVEDYDALITNQTGVALMVQTADCQPILLYDPISSVAGSVHSGWRGSVQNILGRTIAAMMSGFGSRPENIRAIIGPSLGPCCAEFVNFSTELPESFTQYRIREFHFDFWAISRDQLQEAGLRPGNIEVSGVCTACSKDYFSYRRAVKTGTGTTGRLASAILLGALPHAT